MLSGILDPSIYVREQHFDLIYYLAERIQSLICACTCIRRLTDGACSGGMCYGCGYVDVIE